MNYFKSALLAVFMFTCFIGLQAQKLDLSVGVGIISPFSKDDSKQIMPSSGINLDFRLAQHISAGIGYQYSVNESKPTFVGEDIPLHYRNHQSTYSFRFGGVTTKWTKMNVYGGMSFHLVSKHIDYLVGRPKYMREQYGVYENNTTFNIGAYVGVRRHITDHFSLFGEAGTGGSIAKIGLAFTMGEGGNK